MRLFPGRAGRLAVLLFDTVAVAVVITVGLLLIPGRSSAGFVTIPAVLLIPEHPPAGFVVVPALEGHGVGTR